MVHNARNEVRDEESCRAVYPGCSGNARCCGHGRGAAAEEIPRIGFLGGSSASAYSTFIEAFRQSLRDLGYEEGQNIAIDYRYGEGKRDRLPELQATWSVLRLTLLLCRAH